MSFLIEPILIEKLNKARHVVVFTGAGVSAESGIPTFRDDITGLWQNFSVEKFGTLQGFLENPALVWGWYEWRRQKILQAQPNPAHHVIAKLADKYPKLTVITQNIDDLHERAGSKNVLHLHGNIQQAYCIQCQEPYQYPSIEPTTELVEREIPPPHCVHCGGLIRPSVVWFGENLPFEILSEAEDAAAICDVILIIGTSALVYPAINIPLLAIKYKPITVQINLSPTRFDTRVDFNIKGKAGEILPIIFQELLNLEEAELLKKKKTSSFMTRLKNIIQN